MLSSLTSASFWRLLTRSTNKATMIVPDQFFHRISVILLVSDESSEYLWVFDMFSTEKNHRRQRSRPKFCRKVADKCSDGIVHAVPVGTTPNFIEKLIKLVDIRSANKQLEAIKTSHWILCGVVGHGTAWPVCDHKTTDWKIPSTWRVRYPLNQLRVIWPTYRRQRESSSTFSRSEKFQKLGYFVII